MHSVTSQHHAMYIIYRLMKRSWCHFEEKTNGCQRQQSTPRDNVVGLPLSDLMIRSPTGRCVASRITQSWSSLVVRTTRQRLRIQQLTVGDAGLQSVAHYTLDSAANRLTSTLWREQPSAYCPVSFPHSSCANSAYYDKHCATAGLRLLWPTPVGSHTCPTFIQYNYTHAPADNNVLRSVSLCVHVKVGWEVHGADVELAAVSWC